MIYLEQALKNNDTIAIEISKTLDSNGNTSFFTVKVTNEDASVSMMETHDSLDDVKALITKMCD
jgi:hypothetical protein